MTAFRVGVPLAACLALFGVAPVAAQPATMTFFVTSHGPGKGADLGGLAGADKHCQELAASVGAGAKTWHAYLSTQGDGAVNARDRIGKGPWMNAKGVVVAKDVATLHGANNLTKQTALSEKGEIINGRGDKPNRHDILTGSQADGTAFPTARTIPARTGPAAPRARPCSAMPTAWACATIRRRIRGIRRTPRAAKDGGSQSGRPCARPAATGSCTASRPTDALKS